uniref:DNA 5'-3' helicase n=1 Tax=Salmo trutta TaxID=8032 RepID=A0A674EAW9_SALTR
VAAHPVEYTIAGVKMQFPWARTKMSTPSGSSEEWIEKNYLYCSCTYCSLSHTPNPLAQLRFDIFQFNTNVDTCLCLFSSLASRLSDQFQTSLTSDQEKDDDFQPDRKCIHTPTMEQKLGSLIEFNRISCIFMMMSQKERPVPGAQTWTVELNTQAQTIDLPPDTHCCSSVVSCSLCPCASSKGGQKVAEGKSSKEKDKESKKKQVPKIIFGTRSHKQITQMAHEMKRTRDHTCVHSEVVPHSNWVSGVSCHLKNGVHKMQDQNTALGPWSPPVLGHRGPGSAGGRLRACSYYAARDLMPVSYSVPTTIYWTPSSGRAWVWWEGLVERGTQIGVLDEAYNIEDCASYTLNKPQLLSARKKLDGMVTHNIRRSNHELLQAFCCSLLNWMQESCSVLAEREYEMSCKVWNGKEVLGFFRTKGITTDTFAMLQKHLAAVLEEEGLVNGREDTLAVPTISSASASVLESLHCAGLPLQGEEFAEDYRMVLQQSYTWTTAPDAQGFFARPNCVLRHLGQCHSIVLTSGTLSPMGSFSSELGVKFSIQLEAGSHVISKLCHVVFRNLLIMLDKLCDRLTNAGLWEKLEERKTVITEPRGGGKRDFDELLQMYYDAIRISGEFAWDRALLMAVCRGKVSEGLDFTDDNARAVVTVGIPFPNIKDLQVELKMKYNDQHCKARGLLSGSCWYEIQAYRALNQALVRCIRHKNDWGALILVDDRFGNNPNKYISGLYTWVHNFFRHHNAFICAMQSLMAFSGCQQGAGDTHGAGSQTFNSTTIMSPASQSLVTVEDLSHCRPSSDSLLWATMHHTTILPPLRSQSTTPSYRGLGPGFPLWSLSHLLCGLCLPSAMETLLHPELFPLTPCISGS